MKIKNKLAHLLCIMIVISMMPISVFAESANLLVTNNVYVNCGNIFSDNRPSVLYDNISATNSISDSFNLGAAGEACWVEYEWKEPMKFNKISVSEFDDNTNAGKAIIEVAELGDADIVNYYKIFEGSFKNGLLEYTADQPVTSNRIKVSIKDGGAGDVRITEFSVELDQEQLQSEKPNNEFLFLSALGIISGEYVESDMVTRSDFASYVTKLMRVDPTVANVTLIPKDIDESMPNFHAMQFMFSMGYMSPVRAGLFEPDSVITIKDAADVLSKILGYGYFEADNNSGYNSSILASLLKNIRAKSGGKLTMGDCVKLLFNSMEINMLRYEPYNSKGYVLTDGTILKSVWNISTATGILNETDFSSIIHHNTSMIDGRVMIGDTVFDANSFDLSDYLGYELKVYYEYTRDADLPVVKFFKPTAEKILNIKSDEIVSATLQNITYGLDPDNDHTKTVQIAENPFILFNNKIPQQFSSSMLEPQNGEITLIDNDNNGVYESIIILDGVDCLVDSVETDYILFKNSASVNNLKFDDDNKTYRIKKNGEVIPYSDIKPYDLATIFADKMTIIDGEYCVSPDAEIIDIVISTEKIEGSISMISDDGYTINGVEYSLTPQYMNSKTTVKNLSEKATFFINMYGKLAASSSDVSTFTGDYGYVYQFTIHDNAFEDTCRIKLFNDSGHAILQFDDKVSINGAAREAVSVNLFMNTLLTYDAVSGYRLVPQMIKFEKNSEGLINNLYTAVLPENNDSKDAKLELSVQKGLRRFLKYGNTFNNDFTITTDTTILVVPLDETVTDESQFSTLTTAAMENYGMFITEAYNASEVLQVPLLVVYNDGNTSVLDKSDAAVVSHIATILKDDALATCLTLYQKGDFKKITVAEDYENSSVVTNLKRGMVIQYHTNYVDEIDNIRVVFDVENPQNTNLRNSYVELQGIYGNVIKKDGDAVLFRTYSDDGHEITIPFQFILKSTTFSIYNCNTNVLKPASVADVRVMDEKSLIFVRFHYGQTKEVVIFTNYQ